MGDGAAEDADRESKSLIADIIGLVRGPAGGGGQDLRNERIGTRMPRSFSSDPSIAQILLSPSPDLTPLEELQGELAAVRTRIERTDRLIDQIVYRLYGLTEEEIKIVQETT